jgi:hypothetical protein
LLKRRNIYTATLLIPGWNILLFTTSVNHLVQQKNSKKGATSSTYKSLLGTIFKNRRLRIGSAYAEQIEKELRKSVLLFPQFCLPEALRRFSRNLEGIL